MRAKLSSKWLRHPFQQRAVGPLDIVWAAPTLYLCLAIKAV
jgi:hypothetical protein